MRKISRRLVRGTYCLMAMLPRKTRISVGALGLVEFPPGIYVYIGTALGGVEQRVRRHKSMKKKMKWHVDYLLARAEIISIMGIPADRKEVECEVARSLMSCEDVSIPVMGFGSSDCGCKSHLLYFGDVDPEWVAEELSLRLSMLESVYPRSR